MVYFDVTPSQTTRGHVPTLCVVGRDVVAFLITSGH